MELKKKKKKSELYYFNAQNIDIYTGRKLSIDIVSILFFYI